MLPYSISLLEGKTYVCLTPPCNFLNYTKSDIGPCNILSSIFSFQLASLELCVNLCLFLFFSVLFKNFLYILLKRIEGPLSDFV